MNDFQAMWKSKRIDWHLVFNGSIEIENPTAEMIDPNELWIDGIC